MYAHPQLKDTFVLGSLYSVYLKNLYQYYPKENILLLSSETLFSDPKNTFRVVTDFLKLDSFSNIDFKKYNSGNYSLDKVPCNKILRDFYQPYNEALKSRFHFEADWL